MGATRYGTSTQRYLAQEGGTPRICNDESCEYCKKVKAPKAPEAPGSLCENFPQLTTGLRDVTLLYQLFIDSILMGHLPCPSSCFFHQNGLGYSTQLIGVLTYVKFFNGKSAAVNRLSL